LVGGGNQLIIITGTFDVLLADHIRELDEARNRQPHAALLVAVVTPDQPLLDTRARAEMAAALAMVDYVVSLEGPETEHFLAAFPASCIVRLEEVHARRLRELKEHVKRRQSQ
jgi:glycerol-3-phosphate cytidylyltransferase-like family protein